MASARRSLLLAALTVAVWLAALTLWGRGLIIDEWIHLRAIEYLAGGGQGLPSNLAMFPGYHWLMVWPHRWFGSYLVALRGVNLGFSLLALWAYTGALQASGRYEARRFWRFLFLPILFPYLALVYTESASLAGMAGVLCLHMRGRHVLAAGLLLIAVLIRQSNLAWAVLFLGWIVVGSSSSGITRRSLLLGLRRGWPYLAVLAGGALFLAVRGPVASVRSELAAGVNPAQAVVFGLCLGLFTVPLWLSRRAWAGAMRGITVGSWAAVSLLLAWSYRNPHPFNQVADLWRNRVLHVMDESAAARWVLCVVAGGVLTGLGRWIAAQPRRGMLLVWAATSLVYLLPHALVEPRYYILPLVFLGFLADMPARRERLLAVWLAVLTGIECVVIVTHGSLW